MNLNEMKLTPVDEIQEGYCYLMCFKLGHREAVKTHIGPWPTMYHFLCQPSAWFEDTFSAVGLKEVAPGRYHVLEGNDRVLANAVMVLPFVEGVVWPEFSMGKLVATQWEAVKGLFQCDMKLTDRVGGSSIASADPLDGGVPDGVLGDAALGFEDLASDETQVSRVPSERSVASQVEVSVAELKPPVYPTEIMAAEVDLSVKTCAVMAYYKAYDVYCRTLQKLGVRAKVVAPPSPVRSVVAEVPHVVAATGKKTMSDNGYCYLAMVPEQYRAVAASMAGPSPSFESLMKLPAEMCEPSDEMRVSRVSRGRFHLAETGPGLRSTLVCVAHMVSSKAGTLGSVLKEEKCDEKLRPYVDKAGLLGDESDDEQMPELKKVSQVGKLGELGYGFVLRSVTGENGEPPYGPPCVGKGREQWCVRNSHAVTRVMSEPFDYKVRTASDKEGSVCEKSSFSGEAVVGKGKRVLCFTQSDVDELRDILPKEAEVSTVHDAMGCSFQSVWLWSGRGPDSERFVEDIYVVLSAVSIAEERFVYVSEKPNFGLVSSWIREANSTRCSSVVTELETAGISTMHFQSG